MSQPHVSEVPPAARREANPVALLGPFLAGAAVAVLLGIYSKEHEPTFKGIFKLFFSDVLHMKVWLATLAAVLAVAQLLSALWMWGRLPGAGRAPAWIAPAHRWLGTAAFVATVPVAYHCLWSLGYSDLNGRTQWHSILGCAFYGAFTTKMLGLRSRNLPGWALPVMGGLLFALLILVWALSSLWFFTKVEFLAR